MKKALFLTGRMVFGGFFLYNGIHHIMERQGLAQYAGAKKVPQPEIAVLASGALMMAGGFSIITGWQPKLGALAITAFLGGVSPVMHDFWSQNDPNQRQSEMIHFSKNMAMLGAALALMGVEEPWAASLGCCGR